MMRYRWAWVLMAVVVIAAVVLMFATGRGGRSSDEPLGADEVSATGSRATGAKRSSSRSQAERRRKLVAAPIGKSVCTGAVFAVDGASLGSTVTVTLETMRTPTSAAEDYLTTTAQVGPEGGEYRFEINPVVSASVKASGAGLFSMEADTSDLTNELPRGTPRVVVRDFAMQRGVEISGRLVDTTDTPLTGTVTAVWPMEIPTTVEDFKTGQPLNDMTAEATRDGEFRLRVKAGEVMLVATSPGYGALTKTVTAPATGVDFRFGDGALVEGRVLHYGSNSAASSVTVTLSGAKMEVPSNRLFDRTRSSALTDAQGNFLFRGVVGGRYSLTAGAEKLFRMPGVKGKLELDLTDGLSTSGHTLYIYPGHTVKGRVTEKMTGAPMPDVRIKKLWDRDKPTFTDSDGRYNISGVIQGELLVFKEGFTIFDEAAEMRSISGQSGPKGTTLWVQLGDETEVTRDFEMVESLTVSGRVSLKNGDSVPEAKVTLLAYGPYRGAYPVTKSTNPDGTFSLEVLPNTEATINATAPAHAMAWSEPLQIGDESLTGVVILMETGATLAGMVVDPKGNPVSEAEVTARNSPDDKKKRWAKLLSQTQTDANGKFAFVNMPTEGVQLEAAHQDFANSEIKKFVVADGQTRSDIRLELRKSHFIAGRVMDQKKKPVAMARVTFSSDGQSFKQALSDEKGNYRVEGLSAGVYRGECMVNEDASARKDNVEVDRKDVDFIINLETSDLITVVCKVVDWKNQNPITQFEVRADQDILRSPDEPGDFQLRIQPNEGCAVTVMVEGCLPSTQLITSNNDPKSPKEFLFSMGPGGTIIGRVLNLADHSPLGGVKVKVGTPDGLRDINFLITEEPVITTITTDKGEFVFQKTPPGVKQVEVKGIPGKSATTKNLSVSHDKVVDVGDLLVGNGGTVRIQVLRDPGAKPVEGVEIRAYGRTGEHSMAVVKTMTTDAAGKAVFANLPVNVYSFSHENIWFGSNLSVREDSSLDLVLRLGGVNLTGLVMDRGEPALLGSVHLKPESVENKGQAGFSGNIEPNGRYTVRNLPPGTYRATASTNATHADGSRVKAEATVVITGNGDQVLDFTLPTPSPKPNP